MRSCEPCAHDHGQRTTGWRSPARKNGSQSHSDSRTRDSEGARMRVAGHSSAHRVALVRMALLLLIGISAHAQEKAPSPIQAVDAVEITVSNMDRAVDFYSRVLDFKKISDLELTGGSYEHVEGVFGLRIRAVRLKLGQGEIELEEWLVLKGLGIPEDSRSNDRWFQHIAIIVSDMDAAFSWLRHNKVEFASSGPHLLP